MDRDTASASSITRRGLGPWEVVVLSLALAVTYHVSTLEPAAPSLLNLDDGYIHARLGENLARSGVLGINEGSGGGGSSSLLWTLLIAAGAALGLGGDLTGGALSFASLALAVGAASRLAFEALPRPGAWTASIAVAVCGQTVALALSGMETLLFTGLVIAGLRDAAQGRRWDGTPLFCLAALVRVEAVLGALAVALVSQTTRPRRILQVAASAAAAATGTGILAALGGSFPATLSARRWLYGMGESLVPGPGQWTGAIPEFFGSGWSRLSGILGPGGWIGQLWALSVVVSVLVGAVCALRSRRLAHLAIYALLHTAFVAVVLGDDGQLGRYLAPLWMLAPLFVALGFERAYGRWGRAASIGPLVFLLAFYVPQAYRWAGWHVSAVEHLREVHLAMALRVGQLVPPGQSVAAFDIGLLSYAGARRVVDIGGLAEPGMVEAMWRHEVPRLLAERSVRYVVFPEPRRGTRRHAFAARLGFDLTRLGAPLERTAAHTDDSSYLRATKVAMPALALYELKR